MNMSEENKNQDNITKDYDDRIQLLRNQISNIEIKQQDLQHYLNNIDNNVQHLDNLITQEQSLKNADHNKIKNYRYAMTKSIELINQLHNTYKEYENVKFRYFKQIDESSNYKHRLIELEMKKLDDKLSNNIEGFTKMMQLIANSINSPNSGNNELVEKSKKEIISNPDYEL